MTELWLVRHGQTDWNLQGIYQGHSDTLLNTTGVTQSERLAQTLSGIHFDAIYSSDLQRASQTARIIAAALTLPVTLDARLREINQGVWEGCSITDVQRIYQPDFSLNPKFVHTPRAEGAESVFDVVTRMASAANEYHLAYPQGRLLIVTHGLSSASLYCLASGIPLVEVGFHIPENSQPLKISIDAPLELIETGSKPI